MRILFLDDDLNRHAILQEELDGLRVELISVQTAEEAIGCLQREKFDLILLDHDLGGEIYAPSGPGTGFEVAQRLLETQNRRTRVIIHTLNGVGARNMLEVLGDTAKWIPFPDLPQALRALRMKRP